MKCVGYCRVSTENQKEEKTIQIQEQELRRYAASNGLELGEIFKDDGVSGSLENRPGLGNLFDYLEKTKEVSGVLIFKLDRLARDLYIQEHLIKKLEQLGKRLISTKEQDLGSGDPMRKAFRQFMGIVSELEKAFITMRLSGGRINKARKGGYAGGRVPLGYLVENKDLAVNQEQAETVRMIFRLKRNKKGLRESARILNSQNITSARGGKFYASTIKYILENRIYKGRLTYKGTTAKRNDLAVVRA